MRIIKAKIKIKYSFDEVKSVTPNMGNLSSKIFNDFDIIEYENLNILDISLIKLKNHPSINCSPYPNLDSNDIYLLREYGICILFIRDILYMLHHYGSLPLSSEDDCYAVLIDICHANQVNARSIIRDMILNNLV